MREDEGLNRRKVLECMTWVGTGVLWTVAGGVPRSLGLIDQAVAQEARSFTFLWDPLESTCRHASLSIL